MAPKVPGWGDVSALELELLIAMVESAWAERRAQGVMLTVLAAEFVSKVGEGGAGTVLRNLPATVGVVAEQGMRHASAMLHSDPGIVVRRGDELVALLKQSMIAAHAAARSKK